jgi:hypothetical protein
LPGPTLVIKKLMRASTGVSCAIVPCAPSIDNETNASAEIVLFIGVYFLL